MSQPKNKLELYVSSKFKEIYKHSRPTKASGAHGEAGDINQPYFVVECKLRNTISATINRKVWKKIENEVPVGSNRIPLLILANKFNEKFAVMNFEDLFKIFKKSKES